MKNVLVVFGGVSSEHDVSVVSASSVIRNIPADKYRLFLMGITKQGDWYLYEGSPDDLPEDRWLERGTRKKAFLSPDRSIHGITILEDGKAVNQYIDIIFPVLHGKNGEDGTMQGLFQLSGIPFVGCDMASSAVSMDKIYTNSMADAYGIPQAAWDSITRYQYESGEKNLEAIEESLGFPIFVKPANAGSSVGISKAHNMEELKAGLKLAFQHDDRVLFEEFIDGFEVECALNIPALVPEETRNEVATQAKRVFSCLGCSGFSRVDFFVTRDDGRVLFNEINTIPGFTDISMYPKMMDAAGVPYGELCDRLLQLAEEKWS